MKYSDPILGVSFFNSAGTLFLIMGITGTFLVDTRDGSKYLYSSAAASAVFAVDFITSTLYQCTNNGIGEATLTVSTTPPATNSSGNSTTPPATNSTSNSSAADPPAANSSTTNSTASDPPVIDPVTDPPTADPPAAQA
jgi:hypothetical protein